MLALYYFKKSSLHYNLFNLNILVKQFCFYALKLQKKSAVLQFQWMVDGLLNEEGFIINFIYLNFII